MNAPPVLPWYRAYCVAMALLYLLCAAGGVAFLTDSPGSRGEFDGAVTGVLLLGVGLVLAAGFTVALFAPRKPWGWTVGMVAICISLTSCACMPAGIPLLIYWVKPETKAYFGHAP